MALRPRPSSAPKGAAKVKKPSKVATSLKSGLRSGLRQTQSLARAINRRKPKGLKTYLFNIMADKSEFKRRRRHFAVTMTSKLIEGCGGIKNISFVKGKGMVLMIGFRSRYLLKEDVIRDVGGFNPRIGDHQLIDVFDYLEVKNFVVELKKALKSRDRELVSFGS